MPAVLTVAAVDMVDALAEGDLVPAVAARAVVVRAAEVRTVGACFCSLDQALRWKTRFLLWNGQHLASERCRVGMQVVQSTGSLISSSDGQI